MRPQRPQVPHLATADDRGAVRRFGCGCAPALVAEPGGPVLCSEARGLRGRLRAVLDAHDRARLRRETTEEDLSALEHEERDAPRRLCAHYTEQEERGECAVLPKGEVIGGREDSSLGPAA